MKPPLLLIGHGSHDDTDAAEFGRFVHRLRCRLDRSAVEVTGGFVSKARPRLSDSVSAMVARGHHRVVTVPLGLGGDQRTSTEITAALAREQERHPTLAYEHARPLGPDPRVLTLLADRLADAALDMPRPRSLVAVGETRRLRAVSTVEPPLLRVVPSPAEPDGSEHVDPGETAVVLVGEGSTDPVANAEVHRVSRLFWETHAYDLLTVETAFVSLTPPGVPGGLERCRRLGAKRVIIVPYLLFAGGMLERVWAQALAYGAGHPELDIRCAEVIGDCEALADVVIERYEEALRAAAG
ncbi:sirohydrochlorin cobaltochelatase [Sinosporangium album]|uniref:Sirohydrochlorin cobaltochelatase n=1 Tax=Sinosporangium album TaxID=504805 RepID=A0A1G7T7M2_9ACTN|nr:sirohydrochlorin chelatase [Sinosporangium album]SDG30619.1 sirohydrochlorin cobaltochelatase [Sinosporangium album]